MFKTAMRHTPRQVLRLQNVAASRATTRRFLSTAPPAAKSRSWKSSAARWGLAVGVVYYYNTSNIFAEQPEAAIQRLDTSIHHIQDSNAPTLEAIEEERRLRREERKKQEWEKRQELEGKTPLADEEQAIHEGEESQGGIEGLEEEADQQGAFNPETGEINWDCPCLGGMAHGPCGEEFRAAFSCFVYSKEEPKGMECIEKFKGMQDCFREHPEVYASELEEDEVEEEIEKQREERVAVSDDKPSPEERTPQPPKKEIKSEPAEAQPSRDASSSKVPEKAGNGDEGGELVARDAYDATASNAGK